METTRELSLQQLVGILVEGATPSATRNESLLINNTPGEMKLYADPEVVSAVLGNVMNAVVANARKTCIRITAKKYNNVVLMHIRDMNTNNHYAVTSKLQDLQPIAEKIGGFVDVTSQRKKVTTIAFSFPNLPTAA